MKTAFVKYGLVLLLFFVFVIPGWSQGFQGTIRGAVQDPSGALIPGVTVNLTAVATGETRSVLSSDTGSFEFPSLLVASYTVTAELPGFKKYTRENVQVSANTVSDVLVRLEIGVITSEVVVTTGEERVNLTTSQLLGISTRNVVDIPNPEQTGNPNNFAILAPGTTSQAGGVGGQGGAIGGNRPKNNNFVVDGVDNNDPSTTGTLTPVIADAVQEFTLLTNQFNAEYGHSTAGQFITTTKSGGNDFHGGGWWYNQNRHTNSLDNLSPGIVKPRYDWNRFGGQVGGPTPVEKLFFYTAYEYQNRTQAGTGPLITVPTAAGMATLQNLASISGTGVSPVNVGILAAHVPTADIETTTRNVTDERTNTAVPISLGTVRPLAPNFDRTHLFQGNSDYQAGKHHLSGRYSYSRKSLIVPGTLSTPEFNSDGSNSTHRLVFSDAFIVGPRIVNDFRAGYNKSLEDRSIPATAAPSTTDVFGNYNLSDLNLLIGPIVNPQSRKFHIYQFSNNTSVSFGAHTAKFGVEVRNIIGGTDFLPRARGEYTWASLDSFARDLFPGTLSIRGVGIGTFAQNRTAYYGFAQDAWKIHPRVTIEYGLRYEFTTTARDSGLQDLNQISDIVSVRDELNTSGTNIFNTLPAYQQEAILYRIGEQLHFRKPKSDGNNFAPRLGISWDPFGDGKTSVRAGFSVAHDVIYGNAPLLLPVPQMQAESRETNACAFSPKPSWCDFVTTPNYRQSTGIKYLNTGFLEGGAILNTPVGTSIDRTIARAASAAYVQPKEKSPETYTWSLSVQREQFRDWVFEFRYVGNHSVFLPIQEQLNAPVPGIVRLPLFLNETEALATNFTGAPTLNQFVTAAGRRILGDYGFGGVLSTIAPDGQSWYQGGSIRAEKRMSRGLLLNTSYTVSKTIDIIENDLNTSQLNPRRPKDAYNVASNKGLSGLHRGQKFVASWVYDLPRYEGNSTLSKILNEWQFTGSYIIESGQPVSILSFIDSNGDADNVGDTAFFNPAGQKNVGSGVNVVCWNNTTTTASIVVTTTASAVATSACATGSNVVGYTAKNPNAQYIQAQPGMVANLGRNTFLMPGMNTANLSLFKNITVAEGKKLQFRIEMFNAFNHPSFTLGTGTVLGLTAVNSPARSNQNYVTPGTAQFLDSKIFSGGLGNAPFQRIIQWGAKLSF